jgi:hypothetical protein
MAKLRYIGSISTRRRGGYAARRALALVLAVVLVFASVSPAWAVTVEVESEGEGDAPPGAVPGLEEGSELGGEETVLGEEVPALSGEEGQEEVPPEYEAPPPEVPPPAPEATAPAVPEIPAEPEAPPTVPPAAEPVYESGAGPEYQTEAPAPPVVHGESLVAPPPSPPPGHDGEHGARAVAPPSSEVTPSTAPLPAETPTPAAPPVEVPEPASVPPADPAEPGALAGHRIHVVQPGESLWSIATALLPPGAANIEIAAEVHRLWWLNAARIGTGDPDLILVGTRLKLG